MSQGIKIDFNVHEQMIQLQDQMVDLAKENEQELAKVESKLASFFEEGTFKNKLITGDNNGISRYARKAQDMTILFEVTKAYMEKTFESVVNMDRMLAYKVINIAIETNEVDQGTADAIRKNPEVVVDAVTESIKNGGA